MTDRSRGPFSFRAPEPTPWLLAVLDEATEDARKVDEALAAGWVPDAMPVDEFVRKMRAAIARQHQDEDEEDAAVVEPSTRAEWAEWGKWEEGEDA